MNDSVMTKNANELIWTRLSERFNNGNGFEFWDFFWFGIVGVVLIVGLFYVIWMYLRDSRSVGYWALPLGILRFMVYLILTIVFFQPALRDLEVVERQSKVVVLFDVSDSMGTKDDIPDERTPFDKLLTRQDKVLNFLTDPKVEFFPRLTQKNPITAYRFGNKLDEAAAYFFTRDGSVWTRKQYEEMLANKDKEKDKTPVKNMLPPEFLKNWLIPNWEIDLEKDRPDGWKDETVSLFKAQQDYNKLRRSEGLFSGTNLGATRTAFDRELKNVVQGIIVVTDGRMNQGADFYDDLAKAAKARQVPILVVGVGSVRPQIRIDLPSIRAPQQIQPDDKFRVLVNVVGEGLADQEFDISLDVSSVKKDELDPKKVETPQEIAVIEREDPKNPMKKRTPVVLADAGKKISMKPSTPAKFDHSTPARAEVEFTIDAMALANATGVKLDEDKRWEFVENPGASLRFQARVPKNKGEIYKDKEHFSEAADVRVVKRDLRVLVMASAATRDYQFVRTLFVREMDMRRAELCIYLQLPPGMSQPRMGIVQDVDPKRLLRTFPDRLDEPSEDEAVKFYDLAMYDVIIAFDPDWNQLDDKQIKNLVKWVDKGGGLVVVGGPINTVQLASPGTNKPTDKFSPLLDLYPVVLDDIRLHEDQRKTDEPWKLYWDTAATEEMEFLKLAEAGDKNYNPTFLADWNEFFGTDNPTKGKVERGFYNFYPVEKVKTGSLVVARFGDPDPKARMKDNSLMPYIVLTAPDSGRRVAWIGSGELWRLRSFRESWHERFWIKLARYAGARNANKFNRRITPFMEQTYAVNKAIMMDFKIDNKGGDPLGRPRDDRSKPKLKLTLPTGESDKGVKTEYNLEFKSDGLFTVQFQVKTPGRYGLMLTVPETNDSFETKFDVRDANPELENTRPDYEAMARLASDATEVLNRMSPTDRQTLETVLQKQRVGRPGESVSPDEKLKLLFDLKSAELIPNTMTARPDKQTNRGGVTSLWDDGFVFRDRTVIVFIIIAAISSFIAAISGLLLFLTRNVTGGPSPVLMPILFYSGAVAFLALSALLTAFVADALGSGPLKLSYVLMSVVGLLSLEWLTRKLLRLA